MATAVDSVELETTDGRHARRERNRLMVVDAMLSLYGEGRLNPSSDEIAIRAGLSPRSLFRYFDDIDDLVRVAVARHYQRVLPNAALDTGVGAPLEQRIARLIEQRMRLFEVIGYVGVVARLRAPFQPRIATELAAARAHWRDQLRQIFAPELANLASPRAEAVLAAIDVLTSFEAAQLWRDDQGLSSQQMCAALEVALRALLADQR